MEGSERSHFTALLVAVFFGGFKLPLLFKGPGSQFLTVVCQGIDLTLIGIPLPFIPYTLYNRTMGWSLQY